VIVPTYLEPVYLYYGGEIAETGWVLERSIGGFDEALTPYVQRSFGDDLRAVRLPDAG
jgi:hypothetical protein